MTKLMGRYPDSDWAFFLEIREGLLPFEKNDCHPEIADEAHIVLRLDPRAELHGRMYLLNGAGKRVGVHAAAAMAEVRDLTYRAMDGRLSESAKRASFHDASQIMEREFSRLTQDNAKGRPTPVAAAVDIILSRSGQITIQVESEGLLTSESAKTWNFARARRQETSAIPKVDFDMIANQAFFALRDLTHQHYHHNRRSDLLTTVTEWTSDTDEDWRRQTQYGLTRMAIAVRRKGKAEALRQALGIIAYADAFQRHFCGWLSPVAGKITKSEVSYKYDFAALKASIEASLKTRELKDSNRRARLFFMFGTAVTALSILVPSYRDNNRDDLTLLPRLFRDLIETLIANPILTLAGAIFAGWVVDHLFLGFALNPDWFDRARAGVSRAASGVMGTLRKRRVGSRLSQLGGLFAVALFITLVSALSFAAGHVLVSAIATEITASAP